MRDEQVNEVTAVRTWNKSRTTAKVTVTIGDYVKKLGGGRAARCNYVLLYRQASGQLVVLGLRSEPKLESGCAGIVSITDA